MDAASQAVSLSEGESVFLVRISCQKGKKGLLWSEKMLWKRRTAGMKIVVLSGGLSTERDVSFKTGSA